jgi:hypothetical protein
MFGTLACAPDWNAALVIGFYQGSFNVRMFPPIVAIVNGVVQKQKRISIRSI